MTHRERKTRRVQLRVFVVGEAVCQATQVFPSTADVRKFLASQRGPLLFLDKGRVFGDDEWYPCGYPWEQIRMIDVLPVKFGA